jgi:hypothetical protein
MDSLPKASDEQPGLWRQSYPNNEKEKEMTIGALEQTSRQAPG